MKADHERLKRIKNEVTEKKTIMMEQITLKKQTVIILENELEAQEKRLHLLNDVTEKNKTLWYVILYKISFISFGNNCNFYTLPTIWG